MKKKIMLLLLPLSLICGCNNTVAIEKRNYVKGEDATQIKQELSNKIKMASENFSWKGFEEKFELSLNGSMDIIDATNLESTSLDLISIKLNGSLNQSSKIIFDENELKATNPDYAKVAKLESNLGAEFSASTMVENTPASVKYKYDINTKYGYSTIKPVGSETAVSSDFLFSTVTSTVNQGLGDQKETIGILENGLANKMVVEIQNQTGTTTDTPTTNVTTDETTINTVLENLSNYIGYAKSKNSYYISFDAAGLNSLMNATSKASMNFSGNIYAEISFSSNDKFSGFNLELKNISLSMSDVSNGLNGLNMSLNGKCTIREFNGNINAPTQEEVDALGYDKISKLETTY